MKLPQKIYILAFLALTAAPLYGANGQMLRTIIGQPASIANLQLAVQIFQNPPTSNGYGPTYKQQFERIYGSGTASAAGSQALLTSVQNIQTALTNYAATPGATPACQALVDAVTALNNPSLFAELFPAVPGGFIGGVATLAAAQATIAANSAAIARTAGTAGAEVAAAQTALANLNAAARGAAFAGGTTLAQKADATADAIVTALIPASADVATLVPLVRTAPAMQLPALDGTTAAPAIRAKIGQATVLSRLEKDAIIGVNTLVDTTAAGLVPALVFPVNANLVAKTTALVTDLQTRLAAAVAGGGGGAAVAAIDTYLNGLTPAAGGVTTFANNLTAFDPQITAARNAVAYPVDPAGMADGKTGVRDILTSLGLSALPGAGQAKVEAVTQALVLELYKTFLWITKATGYPAPGNPAGSATRSVAKLAEDTITSLNAAVAAAGGHVVPPPPPVIAPASFAILDGTTSPNTKIDNLLNGCSAAAIAPGGVISQAAFDTALNNMATVISSAAHGTVTGPVGPAQLIPKMMQKFQFTIVDEITRSTNPAVAQAAASGVAHATAVQLAPSAGLADLANLQINGNAITMSDLAAGNLHIDSLANYLGVVTAPQDFKNAVQKIFGFYRGVLDILDATARRGITGVALTPLAPGTSDAVFTQATTNLGNIIRKAAAPAPAAGPAATTPAQIAAHNAQVDAIVTQIAAIWPGFGDAPLTAAQAGLTAISKIDLGTTPTTPNPTQNCQFAFANYFNLTTTPGTAIVTAFGTSLGISAPANVRPGSLKAKIVQALIPVNPLLAQIKGLIQQACTLKAGAPANTTIKSFALINGTDADAFCAGTMLAVVTLP
mgnify:CR=1 FL=1